MKILAQKLLHSHIDGFQVPLVNKGYQWIWWSNFNNIYDTFAEIKPNIYFGVGKQNKHILACINKYNIQFWCQIAPFTFQINNKKFKYKVILDNIQYTPGPSSNYLKCQIGCYSSAVNISPYISKICYPIGRYTIRILGPYKWPIPQYLGYGDISDKIKLYRSASIIITNTTNEYYQAISCGNISIMPQNISYKDFISQINATLDNLQDIKIQQQQLLQQLPTYTDVIQDMNI